MKLDVFEVSLLGADERGHFMTIVRVVSANEVEAETLARASAALRDFAVTEINECQRTGEPVSPDYEFPRVLGHSERKYAH
ncbi:MAG: hypothetical protein GYB36_00670 [Alphaproteobacteria bacterium]|nr:hypothetical protein [Alphaproteobacteria bacterium]